MSQQIINSALKLFLGQILPKLEDIISVTSSSSNFTQYFGNLHFGQNESKN